MHGKSVRGETNVLVGLKFGFYLLTYKPRKHSTDVFDFGRTMFRPKPKALYLGVFVADKTKSKSHI
jgi:hypothetical protein